MQFARSIAALAAAALALSSTLATAHGLGGQATQAVTDLAATNVEALTGTVHELIVDDATRGTSQRYIELELADGSLVPLQGDAAQALSRDANVEVRGHRSGNALDVESSRTLPPMAAPNLKALTEVDGTLALLHADNFAEGRGSFVYEVHHASGHVHELRMAVTPSMLEPGMHVRVQGRASADGASMTPDHITILSRQASAPDGVVAKAATANRVLVIMANFNNTAMPAFSASQVQQVMTSNTDSVANFFRETSYGQQLMNVTTTPGWVTLNMPQPTTCGSTDWGNIGTNAEASAKALGSAYDAATYNFVVYVFPGVTSCGWSGLAYINNPHKAWINGTGSFNTATIAHEMGHNFGLLHAASLRCPTAIGGACSSSEYGDPFDAMGNQRAMHYNAMQKAKLAWIPSTSVKTHTGGSATYTLTPIETAGAATYAVKITTSAANRTYWLEFRQPIGFDSPLAAFPNNGAQVRVSYPFETQCPGCTTNSADTELLDMTPSTSTFNDATLPVGQTFTDSTYGVSVTVLSATASALTVQVGIGSAAPPVPPPPPAATATTTTIAATANPSKAGALVTITASVSGNAPTGSMTFVDNGVAIAGCSGSILAGSGNVRSASCSTNALLTGNHSIVSTYGGDAANLSSTSSYTLVVNAPVNGTNVALAANGGVATASTTNGPGFMPSTVIDNKRSGAGWGAGGGWNDATAGTFPDWLQINFAGIQAIDHVVVYSVQDNYLNPVEPTDSMAFTLRGITSFQVQGFNGTGWVTLATVTGNNLVKRTVSFAPYPTDRIRINILGALATWSRVTEVEAWTSTVSAQQANVALAANGGVATASSTYSAGFMPSTVIDNRRSGAGWGSGAGWNDATPGAFADWLQIDFNGSKTIDRAVVYSVQDNYLNPVEPTDSMTFTLRGIRDFQVQGFDGANWVPLATVTGNNLVKRSVTFTPFVTNRIRIYVTNALATWSRVTEVEAWGF
jgi:M6 family metalloprotease-like protein